MFLYNCRRSLVPYFSGMKKKTGMLLVAASMIVLLLNLHATNRRPPAPEVPYPEGFRYWTHIKSGVVGPKSKMFDQLGGFFHIYANEKAMEGYRTGKFPEGSVIAFDRILMRETDSGQLEETDRRLTDVMIKDSAKFSATGGWGYEEFKGNSKIERVATQSCFTCHAKTEKTDYVFSRFRE